MALFNADSVAHIIGISMHLQLPDSINVPLSSVRGLAVNSTGDLFVKDPDHDRILMFDSTGILLRVLVKYGCDVGELSASLILHVDVRDDLYVFDMVGGETGEGEMVIFRTPDYRYDESLSMPARVTQFASVKQGFIVYSPYTSKVISKYSRHGTLMGQALKPKNENLRLFLARVQTGGLIADATAGGFYAIFPEEFYIYHYDNQLNVTEILRGDISSPWRPVSPTFPNDLSPYDYAPPHQDWWNSFLHVSRMYMLSDDVLAVTLFETEVPPSAM